MEETKNPFDVFEGDPFKESQKKSAVEATAKVEDPAESEVKNPGKYDPSKFQEYKQKKHEAEQKRMESCKRLKEILVRDKIWDTLPEDLKQFVENGAKRTVRGPKNDIIQLLFPEVKVGAKVTLLEALTKTLRGKPQIDKACFGFKDAKIEFHQAEPVSESTYEIVSIA